MEKKNSYSRRWLVRGTESTTRPRHARTGISIYNNSYHANRVSKFSIPFSLQQNLGILVHRFHHLARAPDNCEERFFRNVDREIRLKA
jgi:hypothetical protein